MDPSDPLEPQVRSLVDGLRWQQDREHTAARRLRRALVRCQLQVRPEPRPRRDTLVLGLSTLGPALVLVTALGVTTPPEVTEPLVPEIVVPGTQFVQPIAPRADCPEGFSCNPRTIEAFPYSFDGTTVGGDDKIDSYACAPRIFETGPESWFEFQLDESSRLTAALEGDPRDGVDVDLHLLTAEYGWGCIVRDDSRIDVLLPAGRYLLVLDTCDPRGVILPGPYQLTVHRTAADLPSATTRSE